MVRLLWPHPHTGAVVQPELTTLGLPTGHVECLAIVVQRRHLSDDVLRTLAERFVEHGPPQFLRSDNGRKFPCVSGDRSSHSGALSVLNEQWRNEDASPLICSQCGPLSPKDRLWAAPEGEPSYNRPVTVKLYKSWVAGNRSALVPNLLSEEQLEAVQEKQKAQNMVMVGLLLCVIVAGARLTFLGIVPGP